MKVEVYKRPIEHPAESISDSDICLYYMGQWVDFREGMVLVTKDDGCNPVMKPTKEKKLGNSEACSLGICKDCGSSECWFYPN